MTAKVFDSIIGLRFGMAKVAKKEFYGAKKKKKLAYWCWKHSYFEINWNKE